MELRPHDSVENIPALIQITTWHRTGVKSLFEPLMARFTEAYVSLGLDDLTHWDLGPLLLTWINFNPQKDK